MFNRYWPTGGGGEKYAATVAAVLAERFDTCIAGPDHVDLDWLGERLCVDLSNVSFEHVDARLAAGRVPVEPDPPDLYVSVSYMDDRPAPTRSSVYVVMFPHPLDAQLGPLRRTAVDLFRRHAADIATRMTWGEGFHIRDPLASSRAPTWTDGAAELFFETEPGTTVEVELALGHHRPPATLPAEVRIEVDGEVVATTTLTAPTSRLAALQPVRVRFPVSSPAAGVPVRVRILSDSFVPAEVLGTADVRQLGVPMISLSTGSGVSRLLARRFPVLLTPRASLDWLDTYGMVVSISEYTREWVQRWWGIDTEVLYPPVTMHRPGEKAPMILNVGRFFAAERGHSKKQLELVRAFRDLCDGGVRGWTLHLAGGCSPDDQAYLDTVRREAAGYPVEFHIDRPGAELEDLYGRASIYWHASGLGEDEHRHPDRMEHFGITTVEAMSAGAVPVVIGKAGQVETVRHGVDGFHFQHLSGLVALTRQLVDDPELVERMRASGMRRAQAFSPAAFAENLWRIVDRVLPATDPAVP